MSETDNNGLLVLIPAENEAPEGFVPAVDIVAVHGLNGHRINTWRCSDLGNGTSWLNNKEMLPSRIPKARIMTFGYGAGDTSEVQVISRVRELALELLQSLHEKREDQSTVPLIFICHSLGGLVVKELLCIANQDHEGPYFPIAMRTENLIFFGTPHQADSGSSWDDLLFDIALASTEGDPGKRRKVMASVIHTGSAVLKEVSERFYTYASQYHALSFYETKATEVIGLEVVKRACATLDLAADQQNEGRDTDHLRLCQFSTENGGGAHFEMLCDRIKTKAVTAATELYGRFIECHRYLSALYPHLYFRNASSPYPGTLDWVMDNQSFKSWLECKNSTILHIYGRAGCGKTVLSALLARSLQRKKFQFATVVSHYFECSDERRRSLRSLFFAFCRQLLFQGELVYLDSEDTYNPIVARDNWSEVDLWTLLRSLLSYPQDKPVVCVIDGLDECEAVEQVLKYVALLRTQTDESVVKFILTSQKNPAVSSCFESLSDVFFELDLDGQSKGDKELVIRDRVASLDGLPEEKQKAMEKLCSLDATLLEVDLILKSLECPHLGHPTSTSGPNATTLRLEMLNAQSPEQLSLTSLYEKQILMIPEHDQLWASTVLRWLVYSLQPLTVHQLAVAVALDEEGSIPMEQTTADALRATLGWLVKVDSGLEVRLVHGSARDFLMTWERTGQTPEFPLQDSGKSHERLAKTCFQCLKAIEAEKDVTTPDQTQLYDYAASYWHTHLRLAAQEGRDPIPFDDTIQFLQDKTKVSRWFERHWALKSKIPSATLPEYNFSTLTKPLSELTPEELEVDGSPKSLQVSKGPIWACPLYIASFLNLSNVVREILNMRCNSIPDQGLAFCDAAEYGHTDVVNTMIHMRREIVIASVRTALEEASKNGHTDVVRILLPLLEDKEAKVEVKTEDGDIEEEKSATAGEIEDVDPQAPADPEPRASKGETEIKEATAVEELADKKDQQDAQPQNNINKECRAVEDETNPDPSNGEAQGPDNGGEQENATDPSNDEAQDPGNSGEQENTTDPSDDEAEDPENSGEQENSTDEEDGKSETRMDTLNKLLRKAAKRGHVDVVRLLIDAGADVNSSSTHKTAIFGAAENGFDEVVQLLQEAGAEVSATGNSDKSPLMASAEWGHLAVAQALLAFGANTAGANSAVHPLHFAATFGHAAIVRELLDHGDDIERRSDQKNRTALHLAAHNGRERVVMILLERGAEVSSLDSSNNTPLHLAVWSEKFAVVDLLIRHDVKLDAPAYEKYTALHYTAWYNHPDMARSLLEAGAAEDPMADDKLTPLYLACREGNDEIVALLIEYGADANRTASGPFAGQTPLHVACSKGHTAIVRKLVDAGASIDVLDEAGKTPLYLAVEKDDVEITRFLIESGAETSLVNTNGQNLLFTAAGSNSHAAAEILLEANIDINAVDKLGRSPLFLAAAMQFKEVAALFLKHGADMNLKDRFGRSVLDVARISEVRAVFSSAQDEHPSTCHRMVGSSSEWYTTPWCDLCQEKLKDGDFFFHCCECNDDDWDVCSSCLKDHGLCEKGHKLKARFRGDGYVSCEEYSPWVAERKLPIDIPQRAPDEEKPPNTG